MRSNWLLALAALTLGFSGCVCYDVGYTTNMPVRKYDVPEAFKYPITYSVDVKYSRGDWIGVQDRKDLCNMIEDSLMESGVFSTVSPGDKGPGYHVEFVFNYDGTPVDESMAIGFISGYTFCIIPTCEVCTMDGTAKIHIKEDTIYGVGKAEEMRCNIWLPLAPFGTVYNAWTMQFWAARGNVHALVNDIVQEHIHRYLQDVEIREIIEE